jgi:hypothetical protein
MGRELTLRQFSPSGDRRVLATNLKLKMPKLKQNNLAIQATAYHEAGHAVAAYRLGVSLRQVSIEPDESSAGHVKHQRLLDKTVAYDRSDRNRMRVERLVIVCLAGLEAQRKFNARTVRHFHAHSDYQSAVGAVERFTTSNEETQAYINYLLARTRSLLAEPGGWEEIIGLATALLERQRLTGKEAVRIIRGATNRLAN